MRYLFILLIGGFLISCNKYEEGGNFSLRTAKARLVNTWVLNEITVILDGEVFSEIEDEIYEIREDNTFTRIILGASLFGTWEFNGDKTEVIMTFNDGFVFVFKILKLKNKELWLERLQPQPASGATLLLKFVSN